MNYLVKHWNGGLSVDKSFWVNGLLLPCIIFIPLSLLLSTQKPLPVYLDVLNQLLGIIFYVWWVVGMWRACKNPNNNQNGKKSFWIIKAYVFIATLSVIYSTISSLTMSFRAK